MGAGDTAQGPERNHEDYSDAALRAARTRLSEIGGKEMDRKEDVQKAITELDADIQKLQKAQAEETKENKKAQLNEQLARLMEKKNELQARLGALDDKADEDRERVADRMDTHAKRVEAPLQELGSLRGEAEALEKKVTELDAKAAGASDADAPAALRALAEAQRELGDKKAELKRAKQQAKKKDLEARQETYRAQETATRQAELSEAELAFQQGLAEAEGSGEDPEENADEKKDSGNQKKDAETDSNGDNQRDPEADALKRSEVLHDAFSKIAYGLATDLVQHYPGADGNALEQMAWSAKSMFLRISVMIGGTPKWTTLLTPKQQEFLEKKVGMKITEKANDDGDMQPVIEWVDPVDGWEPIPPIIENVFEKAFGKGDMARALAEINAKTTLENYEKSAGEDPKKVAFIEALKTAGMKPKETLMSFLKKSGGKIIAIFTEPSEPSTDEAPGE